MFITAASAKGFISDMREGVVDMLYDQHGQPIKTQELTREKAAPTLTGIRRIWDETVASGLTPQRLAGLLRAAAEGDHDAYLTLAEEMEERDLHYACELGKRKLAVSRLPITVESAGDDQKSIDIADAVRALVKGAEFRLLLKDLLDGFGKGYSVVEILWNRSSSRWTPKSYEWRDPHFFQFDQVSRREIRMRDESDLVNGLPLTSYGFICHVPRLKSGIPIRGGFARLAAWAFMCKGYAVKDWLAFAEVFGMPLRLGKYDNGATEADKDVLRMAVANLGADAAAIFPESMKIELIERKGTGGETVYQVLADWLDAQVSKGILGQTASSAGGAAGLGNDRLQAEVRDDIRDDDAEQLEATLQRDLIIPFVVLNFGPQAAYPTIQLRAVEQEDIKSLAESLAKLVPLGLRVEQSVVRDKLGLPDPDKSAKPEDLLQPPKQPAPAPVATAANRERCSCPSCATARNREGDADPLEAMAEHLGQQADAPMTAWVERLRALTEQAGSLEELSDLVLEAFPGMDSGPLAGILAEEAMKAEMLGRLEARDE
jgi:phage gp29-like protein